MPFQPGVSGNPGGAGPRPKQFMQVLERAIKQDDAKRLRQAAETLLDKAAEGESWAVQMLAERLDGKVPQAQIVQGDDAGGPVSIAVHFVKAAIELAADRDTGSA